MSRSPLLAVFLTVVIDLLGFGIVLPLLPLYGDHYGATPALVGLLFVSFSGMQFLSAPLWGRLSDRVGRRPVILFGLVGSASSYLLFGLSPLFESHALVLAVLFVSRITAGVFGGTIATAYAYIADVTSPEERGRGMALIGVAFGIGFTLGPAIGGLGHELHPMAPGLIAAALSLVALGFAYARLPEPERRRQAAARRWLDLDALRRAWARAGVPVILLLTFVSVTCFALMESSLGLLGRHEHGFEYWEVGVLFSYLGFWSAVAQGYVVRRYLRRVGEARFIVVGCLLTGAGMLGLGAATTLWQLAIVAPLTVLGLGMITPSLNGLLSRRTDADTQGEVLGVSQSLQSLARIVGPMVGLPLFGVLHGLPFYVAAGAMVVGFLLALRVGPTEASA